MTFFCRLFKDCLGSTSDKKSAPKTPIKLSLNTVHRMAGSPYPLFVPMSMIKNKPEIEMASGSAPKPPRMN